MKVSLLQMKTAATPAENIIKMLKDAYPQHNIICDPLSLSVSCHIGPYAFGVGVAKKIA